jgi:PAS domain S-box-containing protein
MSGSSSPACAEDRAGAYHAPRGVESLQESVSSWAAGEIGDSGCYDISFDPSTLNTDWRDDPDFTCSAKQLAAARSMWQQVAHLARPGKELHAWALQTCSAGERRSSDAPDVPCPRAKEFSRLDADYSRARLEGLGWRPRLRLETTMDLKAAAAECCEARVITEARPPFQILHVNQAWQDLCGFTSSEVLGQSMTIVQGERTDKSTLKHLRRELAKGQHCSVMVCNYKRSGEPFINFLQVSPVINASGCITHFVGQLEDVSSKEPRGGSVIDVSALNTE